MFRKSMSKTEADSTSSETSPAAEGTTALTPEQIAELQTRATKGDEHWERLLRTTADFDNFKKRAAREKIESIQYANISLIQKLLPVLDNFEMALAATQTVKDEKLASLQSGVAMIQTQLK